MSYAEEDACMLHEEEDTCMSYEDIHHTTLLLEHVCEMFSLRTGIFQT
jgi:hypothetical protein